MIRIRVNSVFEAIERARDIFEDDPGCEWVIATGAYGASLMFHVFGDLLLHRSELSTFIGAGSIEAAQERIAGYKGAGHGHRLLQ